MRACLRRFSLTLPFVLLACTERPVTPPTSAVSAAVDRVSAGYSAVDLGAFVPVAINESGLILGNLNGHAALWNDGVITDLGTLGGPASYAIALNNAGLAVGYSTTAAAATCPSGLPSPNCHAFLWDGTTMHDLGTLGGDFSSPTAISSNGYITGRSKIASGEYHAFYWDGTTMNDLGTLGGPNSGGSDVDASGHVVGSSQAADGSSHAFEWDGVVMTDLVGLGGVGIGGVGTDALFIAHSGVIAGTSVDPTGSQRSVVWTRGAVQDLGTLNPGPGAYYDFNSFPVAVNARGDVTGIACTTGGPFCSLHGFVWDGVAMHDMGTMGGDESYVADINARGDVVGTSSTPTEVTCTEPSGEMCHAFIWDGSFHDLGVPFGGFRSGAVAINNRGDVVGFAGTNRSSHGVLWRGP